MASQYCKTCRNVFNPSIELQWVKNICWDCKMAHTCFQGVSKMSIPVRKGNWNDDIFEVEN